MSLRDQGFRFCLSPDNLKARWLHPNERAQFYADWVDVTDWPESWLIQRLELKGLDGVGKER